VQKQFVAPHNEYIHLMLDGGVLFLAAMLAAMMALCYTAARAQRGTTRWVIGALAVAVLFYAAIDNVFSTPQFTVLAVVMLGLLAAHPSVRRTAPEPVPVPEATLVGAS
jgi:nicotinamide riboside transporter PnuC